LLFIGPFKGTFFATYFTWFFKRNSLQMPLGAVYCDHVGELVVLGGFLRFFFEFGIILVCRGMRAEIFPKKKFPDFSRTHQNFFSDFL